MQHFPEEWKKSVVVPLLKPGKNPGRADSYRPISLLSMLAKVAEKNILNKLSTIYEIDNKVQDEQFGFRRGHSTVLLVVRVLQEVLNKMNNQQNTVAVALDIQKAFDTVWINGLLYKLMTLHNLPLYIVTLIHSYITRRQFRVRVGSSLSTFKTTKSGVPQGSVLAPKLYNLFMADFPTYPSTKVGFFADDALIYAHSYYANVARAHICGHIRKILPWLTQWKIKLNANKCEGIILTKKFTNNKINIPIKINDIQIPFNNKIKYLGVIIDSRLKFHLHVSHVIQKSFMAMQSLYSLLAPRSHMEPRNKSIIYKQMIRPVLMYAAPVWNGISDTQTQRLQRMQNRLLRCILSADRYTRINDLHDLTNIPTIREYIDDVSDKFYKYKIHTSTLTQQLTEIRYTNAPVHKPLYHRLPIYFEDP